MYNQVCFIATARILDDRIKEMIALAQRYPQAVHVTSEFNGIPLVVRAHDTVEFIRDHYIADKNRKLILSRISRLRRILCF